MSDDYNAVWPGTYGHIIESRESIRLDNEPEPSWADIVLEQAIEEYLLKKAERREKRGDKTSGN